MPVEPTSYLDLRKSGFSTRGEDVLAARSAGWCATTPFGIAVLRHRQAGLLLRDRRLRQGSHAWPKYMGLTGSFADFWTNSVIGQEGVAHRKLRALAVPALSEGFIEGLKPEFRRIADDLTLRMISEGRVDFMASFATEFAGRAICRLLAIAESEWPRVAQDATALGLAMGVDAKSHEPIFDAACDRLMVRADGLLKRAKDGQDKEGYVSRLVQRASELGDISDEELRNLIVISIFGGVDTTRAQLGFLVSLFMEHADQWDALREDPDLAASAVEESLRHRPTTTWSTREAVESFRFEGVEIPKGQTVHILAHATATDPEVVSDTRFDIRARRKIHFGFGGGAHHCLGQSVARADISCALQSMAGRIERFVPDGSPKWLPDSGNTSAEYLPVRIQPG